MSETKTYVVFSQKLAGYLMLHGFVLIAMDKKRDNPTKNVFLFNQSKELEDAISGYLRNKSTK